MKIFAEFIDENEISYRRTTLLQFGDSWDLIGSAVLKNPGSAKRKSNIGDEDFRNVIKLYPLENLNPNTWYNSTQDPTMAFLGKIFSGSYIRKERQLNGVIQLFNLHYIKDANIVTAREKIKNNYSIHLYKNVDEIISLFKDKPVFLGWFNEYNLSEDTQTKSKKIFDYINDGKYMYLRPTLCDNKFYHPIYINRAFKIQPIQETLNSFYNILEK